MYEIIADDNSMPSCTASTRRLAKRRSSRSRTTWNSMSLAVSPPLMKCTDSALGGRLSPSQRAAARDERLRHELPAEGAHRVLAGMGSDEPVVADAVEVQDRQQFVEVRQLDVVLPDPVHMDQVGRPTVPGGAPATITTRSPRL